MSTKKIEQALHAARMSIPTGLYDEALGELEAIHKACVALEENDVGGVVYAIRDRELLGWESPRANAWASAASLIIDIAKESK